MAILEVKDLTKNFGSTEVLKGISFELQEGKVLSVIGSSGSGKTTLLRCINGLETATSGKITVNDQVVFDSAITDKKEIKALEKNKQNIGLVFQQFNLFPQYTALGNVTLAMKLAAKRRPDYKQKKKELQEFIARFSANASKSKQATSRKKLLDELNIEDMPVSSRRFPFVSFKPDREVGNELLTVSGISKTVGDRKVLDNVSFTIKPREKVAFVGTDGLAKTTLFKILVGELEPDEGTFKWGVTTSQSYFPSDNSEFFDGCEDSLIDWVRRYSNLVFESDVRGWLGRLMFSGEEATKKAKVLSGGERVRCMLCKMMLSGANVLIFDEPTNHLDLESIESLNKGIINFPETVLFTSHDHQFVQTIADRIIDVTTGSFYDKNITYDEYLDKLAAKEAE